MRTGIAILAAWTVLLAACAPAATKQQDESLYVRGRAKVVLVDQALGRVVLDYQNEKIEAYWQTEWGYAQGGSLARSDSPFKPPVGLYREPNVKAQEFEGKPGDTVDFIGMRTGRSIFLQGVAVVSH